ncbi:helix-turn-helix domain-containing protein [Roseomonas genomospecies 6]|nr:helix-turn-helix domain-containing protein [Roseomonas genomospecies 6]
MIPARHIPDILAAERALARLDALAGGIAARELRQRRDAARRHCLGLVKLEGQLLDPADLDLALVDPDVVDPPRRAVARLGAGLCSLLSDLQDGLEPRKTGLDTDLLQDRRISTRAIRQIVDSAGLDRDAKRIADEILGDGTAAVAKVHRGGGKLPSDQRQDLAAILATTRAATQGLLDVELALRDEAQDLEFSGSPKIAQRIPAWTPEWVVEIYVRWTEVQIGVRPDELDGEALAIIGQALTMIDQALVLDPGLTGAARSLHRLQFIEELPEASLPVSAPGLNADPDWVRRFRALTEGKRAAWWPSFAKMIAPTLLARACGLRSLWLPIGAAWADDVAVFRIGLAASEDDWIGTLARAVVTAAAREEDRWGSLDRRRQRWDEAIATVRRPRKAPAAEPYERPTARRRDVSAKPRARRASSGLPRLLDLLDEVPVVSVKLVTRKLSIAPRTAQDHIDELNRAGVLRPAVDRTRDRVWRAV